MRKYDVNPNVYSGPQECMSSRSLGKQNKQKKTNAQFCSSKILEIPKEVGPTFFLGLGLRYQNQKEIIEQSNV